MIASRSDYREYIIEDLKALGLFDANAVIKMMDPCYRFQKALRKHEYYSNVYTHKWQRPWVALMGLRHRMLGIKYGFSIPINVFDRGLSIAHVGTIVVNPEAKIGRNCRLHVCTNIGVAAGTTEGAPHIGDNVYIGPGAKIFGSITIASGIAIGANSVVNKSFTTSGITIAGVPAGKISDNGSAGLI